VTLPKVKRNEHHIHAVGKGDPQIYLPDWRREPKFRVGDKVIVKDLLSCFYTRTQSTARPEVRSPSSRTKVLGEDETWAGPDQKPEWFLIVRFNLSELWHGYTGPDTDTLQTKFLSGGSKRQLAELPLIDGLLERTSA